MSKVCISTRRHGDPYEVPVQTSQLGYKFWPVHCLAIIKLAFCFSISAVTGRNLGLDQHSRSAVTQAITHLCDVFSPIPFSLSSIQAERRRTKGGSFFLSAFHQASVYIPQQGWAHIFHHILSQLGETSQATSTGEFAMQSDKQCEQVGGLLLLK